MSNKLEVQTNWSILNENQWLFSIHVQPCSHLKDKSKGGNKTKTSSSMKEYFPWIYSEN